MFSQMFAKTKLSTPQNEIGEIVPVLAGNLANEVITTTQGKFIRTGAVYNKADYPELFAKIGSIGASFFTTQTSGIFSTISTVSYNAGRFVYAGSGGVLRTSDDNGVTWTSRSSGTSGDIVSIIYGNNQYAFIVTTGSVYASANGQTWTNPAGFSQISFDIEYGNGTYVIVGSNGLIRTSTDLTTWTTRTNPGGGNSVRTCVYGNGVFIVGGNGGWISYSTDNGATWTGATFGGGTYAASAYGQGKFLISVASTMQISTDNGVNWTTVSASAGGTINSITYGDGKFFYVDNGGGSGTSTDGITWTRIGTGLETVSTLTAATYGNGIFLIGGLGGAIATSNSNFSIISSPYYNVATQFFVPSYSTGTRFYTLPTYGSNSAPTTVNYIRAK